MKEYCPFLYAVLDHERIAMNHVLINMFLPGLYCKVVTFNGDVLERVACGTFSSSIDTPQF